MKQYYVLLVLQIMPHVTLCALPNVASLLCHKKQCCEPLQNSVVLSLYALTPQQNGTSPPLQDGALCPGYETVLNPRTTQPFPRLQTKH